MTELERIRAGVLDAMLRTVAAGRDPAVVRTLLKRGPEVADEVADLVGATLPGRYVVVGESWQADDTFFTARAIYVDGVVCVVSGSAEVGEDEAAVDLVWLEREEFRAMAAVEREA